MKKIILLTIFFVLIGCGMRERRFVLDKSNPEKVVVKSNSKGSFEVKNDTRTVMVDTSEKSFIEQFKDILLLDYAGDI